MTFTIWSLAVALSIFSLTQALSIFSHTICRQKVWLRGVEIKTTSLLTHPQAKATNISGCNWRILPGTNHFIIQNIADKKSNFFVFSIKGKI